MLSDIALVRHYPHQSRPSDYIPLGGFVHLEGISAAKHDLRLAARSSTRHKPAARYFVDPPNWVFPPLELCIGATNVLILKGQKHYLEQITPNLLTLLAEVEELR